MKFWAFESTQLGEIIKALQLRQSNSTLLLVPTNIYSFMVLQEQARHSSRFI
jgi:hypothetical protein